MYQVPLQLNDKIAAIVPRYSEHGDVSELYDSDGNITALDVKAGTVVRQLARRQSVDLFQLKAAAARLTKCAIWQPLVLAPDLVLVPLKSRKPKVGGDATASYCNFYQIARTSAKPDGCWIEFHSGQKLAVLWKKATVDAHLQRAHLATLAQARPAMLLETVARYLAASALGEIHQRHM